MPFAALTGLKTRLRGRVDSAARGSDVPAGIERGADATAPRGARERGRMRRRLRELLRLREAQMLELGALVLEAHKHGRDDSPVIKTKAAEAAATDAELRALANALDTNAGLETIVAEGIAGPCPTCGTLVGTSARFCSACATPLDGRPGAAAQTDAAAPTTPLTDARESHATDRDPSAADADGAARREPAADRMDAREADAPDSDAPDADRRDSDARGATTRGTHVGHADATGVPARDSDAPDADERDSDARGAYTRDGHVGEADARDSDVREPDASGADAREPDAGDRDSPTTELPAANGRAAAVEATTGREP